MIHIDARNIEELEEFFDDQSTHDQRGFYIKSYRRAVKPLVAAAKAGAPKQRGKLAQSIGTMDAKNEIAILVGAMRPKGAHGHLVENGTVERSYITKRGNTHRTGKMPAFGFMRKAYEATEAQIFETVADDWYDQIGVAIKRANSKMK
jgi:HK97 gp10 family phage protein